MCIQTASKTATTMTEDEYWETTLQTNSICGLIYANGDFTAVEARDTFLDESLDWNCWSVLSALQ